MRGAAVLAAALLLAAPLRAEILDDRWFPAVTIEQMEYRFGDGEKIGAWEGEARIGGDEWKLALESEGEYDFGARELEAMENQFIVRRTASTFFDAKAGIRFDSPRGPNRRFLTVGVEGLAPQWVEADADLFLAPGGKWSARLEMEYEALLTNRLILQPLAEINWAFSPDRAAGIGRELTDVEIGLRLRYELIDRDVSPYVGAHWESLFGETADLAQEEGEERDSLRFVAGLRLLI